MAFIEISRQDLYLTTAAITQIGGGESRWNLLIVVRGFQWILALGPPLRNDVYTKTDRTLKQTKRLVAA